MLLPYKRINALCLPKLNVHCSQQLHVHARAQPVTYNQELQPCHDGRVGRGLSTWLFPDVSSQVAFIRSHRRRKMLCENSVSVPRERRMLKQRYVSYSPVQHKGGLCRRLEKRWLCSGFFLSRGYCTIFGAGADGVLEQT